MMNEGEQVSRPFSEGQVRVRRMQEGEDTGAFLDSILPEIRQAMIYDPNTNPGVLMSMVCGCSGKAAAALAEGKVGDARDLVVQQVAYALWALKGLQTPK